MISSLFENSKSPFKRIYKTRRQTKTHLFSFQDRPQTGPMPASNERKSRLFSKDKTSAFSLKQQKQGSSTTSASNSAQTATSAMTAAVLAADRGSSGGSRGATASSNTSDVANVRLFDFCANCGAVENSAFCTELKSDFRIQRRVISIKLVISVHHGIRR